MKKVYVLLFLALLMFSGVAAKSKGTHISTMTIALIVLAISIAALLEARANRRKKEPETVSQNSLIGIPFGGWGCEDDEYNGTEVVSERDDDDLEPKVF